MRNLAAQKIEIRVVAGERILVIEDEPTIAQGLREDLTQLGYTVTGVAHDGASAIDRARETTPDLALCDIRIAGDIDGIAVARTLYRVLGVPVVFVSAHADAETIAAATEAEPYGYLVKPITEQALSAAVATALQRRQSESRSSGLGVLENVRAFSTSACRDPLSDREEEVLFHLLRGGRVKTIASSLHLSAHTVRSHLKSIFRKTNTHSQEELVGAFRTWTVHRASAADEPQPGYWGHSLEVQTLAQALDDQVGPGLLVDRSGRVRAVSKAVGELLGAETSTLIGANVGNLPGGDAWRDRVRAALAGKDVEFAVGDRSGRCQRVGQGAPADVRVAVWFPDSTS